MPVVNRKTLRRALGVQRLRECTLGTTQLAVSLNQNAQVMDPYLADTEGSGQGSFQRAYLRVGSADYRVGSYNFQSGSLWTGQLIRAANIASGADFEVHSRLSAAELDLCIDQTLLELRIEQEVAIPSVEGATAYGLAAVASPHTLVDYGNVYAFADPTSTVNRQRVDVIQAVSVTTATGAEMRIPYPGLGASMQLVVDGFLQMTLMADDAATVNLPDRDWLLWGAAARAYDMLIQKSPGSDVSLYKERRAEAARAFSRKSQTWQPSMKHKLGFDAPESGNVGLGRMPYRSIDPF